MHNGESGVNWWWKVTAAGSRQQEVGVVPSLWIEIIQEKRHACVILWPTLLLWHQTKNNYDGNATAAMACLYI
jgi:hypothetical protein